jgi:hypothetical protein
LEDKPAGGGGFQGRAGEEVSEPIAHAADLALYRRLDRWPEEGEPRGFHAFLEAALEDLRGDLADGKVVGGGHVAQVAEDVPTYPGGDLGFCGHGSADSWSALGVLSSASANGMSASAYL